MHKTHTVNISEGQTLLLYKDNKILLRKKHTCGATVSTSWESFVGTDEEVNAKIALLGVTEIVKPTQKKQSCCAIEPVAPKKQNFSDKLLKFFKTLFSK